MGVRPDELHQIHKATAINELNSSFHEIVCSPMKLHALSEHSKPSYGKEKLKRVNDQVESKIQTILEIDLPEEKCD